MEEAALKLTVSDIYPAVQSFLLQANLQRTLRSFQKETGLDTASDEKKGALKQLWTIDLRVACQQWLQKQGKQRRRQEEKKQGKKAKNVAATPAQVPAEASHPAKKKRLEPFDILAGALKTPIAAKPVALETAEEPKKAKKQKAPVVEAKEDVPDWVLRQRVKLGLQDEPPAKKQKHLQQEGEEVQPAKKKKLPCSIVIPPRSRGSVAGEDADKPKKPRDLLQVFVGGLPFGVDEAALRTEFSKCGKVSKLNMPVQWDGSSKGIAFISFQTEEEVEAALKYHGQDFRGRTLKVNRGGAFSSGNYKVIAKGLPYSMTEESLNAYFKDCGKIENSKMPKDEEGNAKGFAFITFTDKASCEKALELDQSKCEERWITVKMANDTSQ